MEHQEWEEVSGGDAIDIRKKPNAPIVGTYTGRKATKSSYGDNWIHGFTDPNGNTFSIFGLTMLNDVLSKIEPGTLCKITYIGKVKNSKGQDLNKVKVEVAKTPAAVATLTPQQEVFPDED